MILQALTEYYERKASDPESGIAPEGFEHKEIPFVLVLDRAGTLVNIEDTRQPFGKRLRAKSFLVPQGEKRTAGVKANLLWDNLEYVLGVVVKGNSNRVAEQHNAFVTRIRQLNLEDDGVLAVLAFLNGCSHSALAQSDCAKEILETNPFMSFRLTNDVELVCQRKAVISRLTDVGATGGEEEQGLCLISGEKGPLLRLQHAIKGVRGTNTTGGNLVSFNLNVFNSYNKEQGANAPMGKRASSYYATSLNHLLSKDSKQKIQIGDATCVFWSDKKSHLEEDFSFLFDEPEQDNPDRLTEKVRALLNAVESGSLPPEDNRTRFYILGLSPNSARISVRFWHVGTVAEFSQRIAQHFRDLEIDHAPNQRNHQSIDSLLRSIAALNKAENIPPNLVGEWMRAILTGAVYPETLLQSAIRRIKAEREVSYARASIVKACLNRKVRYQHQPEKEITMSLDTANINPGYRSGRLFAVLEKIQEDASPGLNATIRDRYYSAASGTPASVFPVLLRMKNHHIGKLEAGRKIWFEKIIAEVIRDLPAEGFPAQLNLGDQGRFAIGYYHQRQALFSKIDKTELTNKGE